MAIRSFRDLDAYKEALELMKAIHMLIKHFPSEEKYLLIDQMKRASRVVLSLIAEGWAKRKLLKEFQKYLRDAIGEANEMTSHLEQSSVLGYVDNQLAQSLIKRYDHLAGKLTNLKNNWQIF